MNKQITAHKNKLVISWNYALGFLLILLISSNTSFAANGVNVDSSSGLALEGYDTVAYFTEGKPVKGKKEFTAEHQGNKYAFSNAANKQTFLKSPDAYLPQYGGFCAYAASKNSIASVDPRAWAIHDNKLYLNYSKRINKTWLKKKVKRIIDADRYWPELKKKAS